MNLFKRGKQKVFAHLYLFAHLLRLNTSSMETVRSDFWRMRRSERWVGWALCLCASLAVSARDARVNDMPLDVMHEDGAEPETAAPFLRCNKVRRVAGMVRFDRSD